MPDPSPPHTFGPGDLIAGKYRIEAILGRGGMGMVVSARHVDLRTLVAIKFMLPEALCDTDAVERFLREAQAAARLKSVHAVKIHDFGRLDNGAPYIVMEHLEGQDLKALAKKRGVLPVREACAYLLQACEALREAHAAGIVHRDLKTANLFLTHGPHGEPCVKVLDFGIAKVASDTDGKSHDITRTKHVLGSPSFMSPEQIRSSKHVDARSDIWALGVILFRLTTGAMPFEAQSMPELFVRILEPMPAQPPSAFNPIVPESFDDVVLRCLQKDASLRFSSVAELAAALRKFTEDDDIAGDAAVATIPLPSQLPAAFRQAKPRMPSAADFPAPPPRQYSPADLVPIAPDLDLSPLDPSGMRAATPAAVRPEATAPLPFVAPIISPENPTPRPLVEADHTGPPWSTTGRDKPPAETRSTSSRTIALVALIAVLAGALGLVFGIGIQPRAGAAPTASSAPEPSSHPQAPIVEPQEPRRSAEDAPMVAMPTPKAPERRTASPTPAPAESAKGKTGGSEKRLSPSPPPAPSAVAAPAPAPTSESVPVKPKQPQPQEDWLGGRL